MGYFSRYYNISLDTSGKLNKYYLKEKTDNSKIPEEYKTSPLVLKKFEFFERKNKNF